LKYMYIYIYNDNDNNNEKMYGTFFGNVGRGPQRH